MHVKCYICDEIMNKYTHISETNKQKRAKHSYVSLIIIYSRVL